VIEADCPPPSPRVNGSLVPYITPVCDTNTKTRHSLGVAFWGGGKAEVVEYRHLSRLLIEKCMPQKSMRVCLRGCCFTPPGI
jgi:hypothetical protein